MAFISSHDVDPRLLGAYAHESGRAPAVRENTQRSIELAQQAAQFNAQLAQHATDRNAQQYAAQQNRAADLQQEQMRQQGFAYKNDLEAAQAERDNAAGLQQERIQQAGHRQRNYDTMVQRGLQSGELYHSPQQKQSIAELQRQIGGIYADQSIPPEQQDAMAERLHSRMRSIVPMARSQDEVPKSPTERFASGAVVQMEDGSVVPIGEMKRPPKAGEIIGTPTFRNGQETWKYDVVKPINEDKEVPFWENEEKVGKVRDQIFKTKETEAKWRNDTAMEQYKLKMQHYRDTMKAASDLGEAAPNIPEPTPPELVTPQIDDVEAELWRQSGGRHGKPLIVPQQPVPQPAIPQPQIAPPPSAPQQPGDAPSDFSYPTIDPDKYFYANFKNASNTNINGHAVEVSLVNNGRHVSAKFPGSSKQFEVIEIAGTQVLEHYNAIAAEGDKFHYYLPYKGHLLELKGDRYSGMANRTFLTDTGRSVKIIGGKLFDAEDGNREVVLPTVKVRTLNEAKRLPIGTKFLDPSNVERTR